MNLEEQMLVHRYRYYVMNAPVITDYEYDELEMRSREELEEDSIVRTQCGSSLKSDYPQHVIDYAESVTCH